MGVNNRARLPCQKVPHHAHRHFLCSALEISHFFGKQSEFVIQKGNILWQIERTHAAHRTSILFYAEVYRYTFETLQEIPRDRQWFCQKIWDRKHMKSTDRRIFHFIGGVIEKHTPRGGLPLLRPKKPQSKSVRKRSSPNAFSLSLSNILGTSLFSIWVSMCVCNSGTLNCSPTFKKAYGSFR